MPHPERRTGAGRRPPATIDQICDRFALGRPRGGPEPVSGGLLHRMWRLETTGGRFAAKELNREVIGRPASPPATPRPPELPELR